MNTTTLVLSLIACVVACGSSAQEKREARVSAALGQRSCMPYSVPDSLRSPNGTLLARVSTAEAGLRRLDIMNRRQGQVVLTITEDVANLLWLPDDRGLVYAVGPVYGVPGIYLFDARMGTTRRVVAARSTSDAGYPDGADLFVLCSVEHMGSGKVALEYLWFPHIDSVDLRRRPLTGTPHRLEL